MTDCDNCEDRYALMRQAVLDHKIAAALGHAAKGVAEMAGLKAKTGSAELAAVHDDEPEAVPDMDEPAEEPKPARKSRKSRKG